MHEELLRDAMHIAKIDAHCALKRSLRVLCGQGELDKGFLSTGGPTFYTQAELSAWWR